MNKVHSKYSKSVIHIKISFILKQKKTIISSLSRDLNVTKLTGCEKQYISTTPKTTKLDRIVAYEMVSPNKRSYDALIMWSHVVTQ